MSKIDNHAELRPHAFAIGVWENEGGASRRDTYDDHQYGRRIEMDQSWTVYQVFTGIAARADGRRMTGLNRLEATDCMLSLNLRNAQRRKDHRRLR